MELLEESMHAFTHRMFVSLVVAGNHECHHVGNQRMAYLTELVAWSKVAFPYQGFFIFIELKTFLLNENF